jgi:hypothetical protein
MKKEKLAEKFRIVFHNTTDYAMIYVATTAENAPRKNNILS